MREEEVEGLVLLGLKEEGLGAWTSGLREEGLGLDSWV